jgi:hypothetical protein
MSIKPWNRSYKTLVNKLPIPTFRKNKGMNTKVPKNLDQIFSKSNHVVMLQDMLVKNLVRLALALCTRNLSFVYDFHYIVNYPSKTGVAVY